MTVAELDLPGNAVHPLALDDPGVAEPLGEERLIGIGIGILMAHHQLTCTAAERELVAMSRREGAPIAEVAQRLIAVPRPSSPPPPAVEVGFVALDRDAHGLVLTFTGNVTREGVRRFQLLVPPSEWSDRVDLTGATFLSVAALDLLRQLARKQQRAGARLRICVTDPVIRHQLFATGVASIASVRLP